MPDHLMDWLQDKALGWSHRPPANKVDTHHHFVPPFYRKGHSLACMNVAHQLTRNLAIEDAGGDPSGWPTPHWSATRSELLMNRLGVQTAILSVTAPGACILKGTASFALARQLNEYAAELRDRNPQRFGFFASIPSLLDTDATLSEIAYALDTLHADGVTLFTRYGDSNVYLGHRSLEPIWAELDRRNRYHPCQPQNAPTDGGFLGDLESYEMEQELRDMINFGNATKLIPRLAKGNERNLLA
ncbi:2-amino-3-carboxymuconate-6-semialdehyde decarboxylase [Aspergillus udagawae]|uniref:6-methylsalicylate decarboxylase n=1 Tax=Aspergillus udagawae TaxID=91492 RepID=A0A8H3S563_9EURO|nr:2-amino-3-carboxymuconate-6-semialdehyde decarboxylase [Aspergillus udagawae]